MPAPNINACAFCGHHVEWHMHHVQSSEGKKSSLVPCHYLGNRVGGKCRCVEYCPGFEPDAEKGLTCTQCRRNVFDHDSIRHALEYTLTTSQGYKIATTRNGIIYQVKPQGLMLCCRWTLEHFMRTHPDVSEKELRVGFAIKCVRCDDSIMEIVPDNFQLGPTWAWRKPARKEEPSHNGIVLPYD